MSKRRVVITGLGIVSPVGSTVETAWSNVLDGQERHRADHSLRRQRVSGALPRRRSPDFDAEKYLSAKELRKMDPFMHYGYAAAADAIKDSGIEVTPENAQRIGVAMGAGIGGLDTIEENYDKYAETKQPEDDLAVLRARQHHQHDLRPRLDQFQAHRSEHRDGHRVHDVDARDRPRDAPDPVRRCRRDDRGRR